jgi:hypothetical protein
MVSDHGREDRQDGENEPASPLSARLPGSRSPGRQHRESEKGKGECLVDEHRIEGVQRGRAGVDEYRDTGDPVRPAQAAVRKVKQTDEQEMRGPGYDQAGGENRETGN